MARLKYPKILLEQTKKRTYQYLRLNPVPEELPLKEKYYLVNQNYVGDNAFLSTIEPQNNVEETQDGSNIREQVTKRKRLNDSTQEVIDHDKRKMVELKANVAKICKQNGNLEKVVRHMYKPKKEFTETAGRLVLHAENLRQIKIENLSQIMNKKPQTETREEETQIEKSRKYFDKVNQELKESKGMLQITQTVYQTKNKIKCNECKMAEEKAQKRRRFKSEETFNNFYNITKEDWKSELFPKILEETIPI